MTSDLPQPKIVVCPACSGPSVFGPNNRFRPFCSERCKNVDLGAWASESFRMPADAPPDDQVYGDAKLQ
ncbi:DNA gyrase inhibitor YacG [Polaromonas eurypsychrophila]|uniref:DNA gyrase inhibitor YacG n=1 Tax=Polaromonas eurypsychrophila TaxID=1614635 RepID=A0A916SDA8_9BURK|nr:DNA gyrase inhibitor YacG [Polaromonas eurypsychrophila]GGA92195.1 DNA gyrase inhibitor YacG [Polaromonas eurypsychrophila]